MKAQDQADTVTYMFESLNQETVPDYKMKLMTLEQEHLSIPETDYSAIVGMPQETPKDAKLPHRLPKAAKMSEELTTEELPKIGSSVALGSFWAIHNPEAPRERPSAPSSTAPLSTAPSTMAPSCSRR